MALPRPQQSYLVPQIPLAGSKFLQYRSRELVVNPLKGLSPRGTRSRLNDSVGGVVGQVRSDIAAAAARLTSSFDVYQEIRQLGAFLREGEIVHRLATGVYGSGSGWNGCVIG